ncbi:hypothetical protein CHL67_04395 [Prosthecochloris sp. GSB1]|uniref:TolC family protein n=1 Tax=Prosthecochloris sp. GSB1 TaxID=281093 RepID=UPI000B8CBEA2|nr:TolC family protein [Prosthecochloris sp. GSB1]ASQ90263.1 hypothetical protein CHL67_04395 [Prosthecochloris sp. GSB1]
MTYSDKTPPKHAGNAVPFMTLLFLLFFRIAPCAEPVTLESFSNLLKRTHPFFQKERLTSEIETAERQSFLGDTDWNVTSSLAWSREEETINVFNPEVTSALSFRSGVGREFWETGGRLTATYSLGRTSNTFEQTPLFSSPERFYENSFELQYSQPLLRNRGGKLSRLQYDLKGFDIDAAEIQAKETSEEFLVDALSKYLDWVYLEEQMKIVSRRLTLSRSELDRTERKFGAYLVDSADVMRSKDAVNTWRQNLAVVETRLSALRSELSVLVQRPFILDAQPDFNLYSLQRPAALRAAKAKIEDSSRVLRIIALRKEQLDRGAEGVKESGKPDLSLVAAVTAKSAAERTGDSFTFEKKDAALGLQLSVPLENTAAKANYRKNRLQLLQLEKEREDALLSLNASLGSLHTQLTQLERVLDINRQQIETARLRTREETKIYEQGRGDLTFVIMSRDNEESAKLAYAENALNYQKLWLRYQALLDELYR